MKVKQQRINNIIAKLVAEIIQFDLKDPDLGLITITAVETSPDLTSAKVYVMISGNEKQKAKTLNALDKASGYIRSALAKELTTHKTPEIRFVYDDSLDRAERIDELLRQTNSDKE